jgi:hypothetical protein
MVVQAGIVDAQDPHKQRKIKYPKIPNRIISTSLTTAEYNPQVEVHSEPSNARETCLHVKSHVYEMDHIAFRISDLALSNLVTSQIEPSRRAPPLLFSSRRTQRGVWNFVVRRSDVPFYLPPPFELCSHSLLLTLSSESSSSFRRERSRSSSKSSTSTSPPPI